jgi:hypothetical protein
MISSVTINNFFFKTSKKKIFFICNILGLAFACLIIFIYSGKFKINVILLYPSSNDFLVHNQIKKFGNFENNFLLHDQFKTSFNKNLLSNKNLVEFINNNTKDNLLLQGSIPNIKIIKKLTFNINDGEFSLVFDKSVDGEKLFVNYINYVKKITINNFFTGYRQLILLNIKNRETFLKDAEANLKKIQSIELIPNYSFQGQLHYEIMLINKEIKELKILYNEYDPVKFDYIVYEDSPSAPSPLYYSNYSIIFLGSMFGSLLFLVIIFLNSSTVNKKKISLKNNL